VTIYLRDPLKALKLSISLNTVGVAVKLAGSAITGSLALLVDALDSFLNIFTGLVVRKYYLKAQKPPDIRHPYGHHRYEAYATVLVLIVMTSLGVLMASATLHEMLEGRRRGLLDPLAVVFASLSFVVNGVSVYFLRKQTQSIALRAEAKHLSIDVAESATVLVGVVFASIISGIWDLVAALIVLGFIVYNSYQTLLELKTFIMDVSPSEEELRKIIEVIKSATGAGGFHALRARKIGDHIFVDFHLLLNDTMTLDQAHRIASLVEKRIKEVFDGKADVVIHIEPESSHDEQHKY